MNQKKTKNLEIFRTSDLGLAGVISIFFPIDSINRQNLGKAEFLFRNNSELVKLVEQYWKNKVRVEPKSYFNSIRNIKTRLYAGYPGS